MGKPENGSHRLAYDANDNPIYEGWAIRKGTATSAASWKIRKLTWSAGTGGDQVMTLEEWADGNELCDNIWDNRATTVAYE